MYERREILDLTDTELLVAFDGVSARIRRAWEKNEAGKLRDVTVLGLLSIEANIRGIPLRPLAQLEQLPGMSEV